MIITLTPNPSVDQTVWVDRLQPGMVHRPIAADINPAGKGINVSRMAHRLGWPTIAFGVLAGGSLPDLPAVTRAARELAESGVARVIISMGEQGAVCAAGPRTWVVHSPRVERRSTVGSGDSMVAGLAIALVRGDAIEQGLRLGAAAGAATAMTAGTALGTAEQMMSLLPQVRVEELA